MRMQRMDMYTRHNDTSNDKLSMEKLELESKIEGKSGSNKIWYYEICG